MNAPDVHLEVVVPEDYDLHGTLRVGRLGAFDPTWRLGRSEAAAATITRHGPVTARFTRGEGAVGVDLWGPGAEALVDEVPRWLGLEDDPSAFAPDHPALARLARAHRGDHLIKEPVLLERLVRTILQQRVTWEEACRSWGRLCRALGEPAPGPLGLHTPPDPRRLARAASWVQREAGIDGRRAALIRELSGRWDAIENLRGRPVGQVVSRLSKVRGLGPWTLAMTAGFGLGAADAVPTGDVHLPSTVAWMLERRRRAGDREMLGLLEPFRPHRWRVVRLMLMGGVHAPRRSPKRPRTDRRRGG